MIIPTIRRARFLDEQQPQDRDWHSHPEGQLYRIENGVVCIETDYERWVMPAGMIGWMPPEQQYRTESFGPASGWIFYLAPCDALPDHPKLMPPDNFLLAATQRLATLSQAVDATERQQRLLAVICDEAAATDDAPQRLPLPTSSGLKAAAMTQLRALSSDFTLAQAADEAHMSRRSFTRHFQAETGLTFGQWRQQARMLEALRLLNEGQSLINTALTAGYDNLSAFIKMFRRHFGITPGDYLKHRRVEALAQDGQRPCLVDP